MSVQITKWSVGLTWMLALAAAIWVAVVTRSMAGWAAVVFIALLPAVMMMIMGNTPSKSMAQIIRDVDAGQSP